MVGSRHRRRVGLLGTPGRQVAGIGLIAMAGVLVWAALPVSQAPPRPAAAPTSASPPASVTLSPTVTPSPSPSTPAEAKLLIGIGDEADRASGFALTRQAPVRMLTSWFNHHSDLAEFMSSWRTTWVPKLYRAGFAMHVVVWSGDDEGPVSTSYGLACGRREVLSDRFLDDLRQVAQIFAGTRTGPPLYVTLFTEFSTYPCRDNEWSADKRSTNYYLALKDRYRAGYQIFHQYAPNAKVSLGFGGWLATYDYPEKGGGRSLLGHFTDLMKMSDFQSFQAMDTSTHNPEEIRAMAKLLGGYGPVMLAHYKPNNQSQPVFDSDVRQIFTDSFIRDVTHDGLFAMSFMNNDNLAASPKTFDFVRSAVTRYGRGP